ncbi:hypothetical protein [Streptomyces sp. NPDC001315]
MAAAARPGIAPAALADLAGEPPLGSVRPVRALDPLTQPPYTHV